MHGTFQELRAAHPGKWLLIRTDGRGAATGTLLAVHGETDRIGEALLREPEGRDRDHPLYITYSESEKDNELVFIF